MICKKVIEKFDSILPKLYDAGDFEKEYIEIHDRRGNIVQYPILSVSIGVATNVHRELKSHIRVAEVAAEMKNFAKTFRGSVYKVDKRKI